MIVSAETARSNTITLMTYGSEQIFAVSPTTLYSNFIYKTTKHITEHINKTNCSPHTKKKLLTI